MATETVYVLQLQHGCWYVGKTSQLEQRMRAHETGSGPEWTKLHPPLRRHSSDVVPADFATGKESRVTAQLMLQHGVAVVRGAEFAEARQYTASDEEGLTRFIGHHLGMDYRDVSDLISEQLPEDEESEESSSSDEDPPAPVCYSCQQPGHFVAQCPLGRRASFSPGTRAGGGRGAAVGAAPRSPGICYNCQQPGHYAPQCPVRALHGGGGPNIRGVRAQRTLEPEPFRAFRLARDGGGGGGGGGDGCFRCGRTSHWFAGCYASRHLDGSELD